MPDDFRFSIGGQHGPSFEVELEQSNPDAPVRGQGVLRELTYRAWWGRNEEKARLFELGLCPGPDGAVRCPPIRTNRDELRAELDRLAVWDWQSHYYNADIIDGTQWGLRVRWGYKAMESSGSNAYPESTINSTDPFGELLAAVRAQLGGRELY